jgi:hypothetical protein
MKAINISTNNMGTTMNRSLIIDLSDRQPCWYANLEDKSPRSKAKWVVGVKKAGDEDDEEYSFKVSKAGDVKDDGFWTYASSVDFAVKLIDTYKDGGKSAVVKWVKDGCPGFVKRGK